MEESIPGLKREKNNLYQHLCELLTHLPLVSDSNHKKIDSIKNFAAISEYIKNSVSKEKEAEPLPEDKVPLWVNLVKLAHYQKKPSSLMAI